MTDASTNRPTILVVDDSRLMRVAARKILKEDFDILEAEDGEVAWETLQATPTIKLVMSDLSMPNLDGLGLLKKIRESSQAHVQNMPVIIVTGAEDDDGSKKTALAAGASDFITKPFESVQLLARTKAQALQQRTQQALENSQASNQQLEQQSHVDQLTGLANRRAFLSHMEEDLSYAIRHSSELAVLLVRVNKYKVMFLRRGKQAAEDTLRRLAGVLKDGRRREDTVARIGMDTFGILLPSANPPGANSVAEQLRTAIAEHDFSFGGEPQAVSVSIGIANGSGHPASDADALMAVAQQALDAEPDSSAPAAPAEVEAISPAASQAPPPDRDAVAAEAPAAETTSFSDAVAGQAIPEAAESKQQSAPTERPQTLSANDVAQALQALSSGAQPACDPDALVHAVIPLLESWSRAHNDIHRAIIEQLKMTLGKADSAAAPSQASQAQPETV